MGVVEKEKVMIPELRFEGFKGPWNKTSLFEVSENVSYGMNAAATQFDGLHKYLRITDIDEATGEFKPKPLTSPEGEISDKFKLKNNDIVFTRTGASVGKPYLYNEKDGALYYAGFLIKFSIINSNSYFIYCLTQKEAYNKWVHVYSMRSGQPGLNAEEYKALKLNLPSLPEQQKIAAFLSSVDEKIQQLNRKKKLLDQYKKGVMQQLFSGKLRFKDENGNNYPDWEEKRLGETLELLTDFEANGSFAGVKDNVTIYDKTEYAWYVRATDLENKTKLNAVKYVDKKSYDFLKKTPLLGNELLITKRGEIGKVYFFKEVMGVKATVAPNMYLLKFKDFVLPLFFYYFFTNYKGNNLLKRINASSTLGALYKNDVKNIKTLLPSFSEQQKIANYLSNIDKKIEQVTQQITQTQAFKKGLLQQMFV